MWLSKPYYIHTTGYDTAVLKMRKILPINMESFSQYIVICRKQGAKAKQTSSPISYLLFSKKGKITYEYMCVLICAKRNRGRRNQTMRLFLAGSGEGRQCGNRPEGEEGDSLLYRSDFWGLR